jgi:hypothetical protein
MGDAVSIPDLDLTVRLVGLPLPELWGRYVAIGGTSTLPAFAERIAGEVRWSRREDLFLAVALNDELIDRSVAPLDPLADLLDAHRAEPGLWPAHTGDDREAASGGGGWGTDHLAADMDALIERSRENRSFARNMRTASQEVRLRVASARERPAPWAARHRPR